MIAKFPNLTNAEDYNLLVQNEMIKNDRYIAKKWSNVIQIENSFYVPIKEGIYPESEYELVDSLPITIHPND